MKKISVDVQNGNYVKKIEPNKNLVDIRPHILNGLHIYENSKLASIGKSPAALIVGSISSYEDISKKLNNNNFSNWYWDDDNGLQLVNYPGRSIKILDKSDESYSLNRCFDFLWIKSGSIRLHDIAQSIVTIVASHGKVAIPHPEVLSKKYYEQFIPTKYLDGTSIKKYENIINENGIRFDCIHRDDNNDVCCLIQNNSNSYNSTIAKINKDEYTTTETFNVINYNLLYRNNNVLENLGIKSVESWYLICESIQEILNNQVYVQGYSMNDIFEWRFYLGYPKILMTSNTNVIPVDNTDRKYVFTVLSKDNIKVDIK